MKRINKNGLATKKEIEQGSLMIRSVLVSLEGIEICGSTMQKRSGSKQSKTGT